MEQITYLKNRIEITPFPLIRTKFCSLGSFELICLSTLISLISLVVLGNPNMAYLLNGLFLPIFVAYYDGANLHAYWPCFALLMIVRRFTSFLLMLDVF